MKQAITGAKLMTPYDVSRSRWVNDLVPDKIECVCVLMLFLFGGSECKLHMDIPSFEQNLFASFETTMIRLFLVIYRFLFKRYKNHLWIAKI